MSAYDIGYYFGFVFWFALGLALLLTGLQRKRRTTAARDEVLFSSFEAPAELPEVKGSVRVGFGIALVVLSVVTGIASGIRAVAERNRSDDVQVVMPSTLLGMQRHDAYYQDLMKEARARLSFDLESSDVAWYGSAFGGVVVIAGRGEIGTPAREIDDALERLAEDVKVLARKKVSPATPQGAADCARVQPPQEGAYERFFCLYVDRQSLVLVSDGEATTIEDAAARGRAIQREVVVKASSRPAKRTASPVSSVKITLPPTLLGATKDTKVLVKERAAHLKLAAPFTRQVDIAAYGAPSGDVFLVDAMAADMTSRASFLRQYRDSLAVDAGKDPGGPIRVPGVSGGDGYCWKLTVDGSPTVVCALVDDASYVVLYQFDNSDVTAVATKARQVRALVRKDS